LTFEELLNDAEYIAMNQPLSHLRQFLTKAFAIAGTMSFATFAVGATVPALAEVEPSSRTSPRTPFGTISAQLKQSAAQCQTVSTRSGLYVRSQPTVYSEALTALPSGTTVSVAATVQDGWIRIAEPINGFVFGDFLRPCSAPQALAPTSSQLCRQVATENGLYVRKAPTVYSDAIAQLDYGQQVSVNNSSEQWMPISAPVDGYVFSSFLTACSP
jgi:uncharacterized protein YgiM (DUF1202 family)